MMLGLQSFVVGLIASLFGILHLLLNVGVPIHRDDVRAWVKVALPSLLIVVPFGFLCLDTLHDTNAIFTPIDAPGWNFQRLPAVDLAGFAPLGDWVHPDTRDLNPGIVPESFDWLGVVDLSNLWAVQILETRF